MGSKRRYHRSSTEDTPYVVILQEVFKEDPTKVNIENIQWLMKAMQLAVHEALTMAADKAQVVFEYPGLGYQMAVVDKQSILDIEKLFL